MAELSPDFDPLDPDSKAAPMASGAATALDVGKSAAAGATGLVSQIPSVAQYGLERAGMPNAARVAQGMSMIGHGAEKAISDSITPAGKRALDAKFIPEDGGPSVFDAPVSSLLMKGANMAPALAAMAAFPEGVIGASIAGGAMQAGQVIDNAMSATNNLSDEDLQKQSPTYAHLRQTMDEDAARGSLHAMQVEGKDVAIAGVTGALGMGAAGRILKGGGIASGQGLVGRTLGGAAEAGLGMGAAGADVDYALQKGNIAAGQQSDIDWHRTMLAGLNSAAEGGVIGGVGGALHRPPVEGTTSPGTRSARAYPKDVSGYEAIVPTEPPSKGAVSVVDPISPDPAQAAALKPKVESPVEPSPEPPAPKSPVPAAPTRPVAPVEIAPVSPDAPVPTPVAEAAARVAPAPEPVPEPPAPRTPAPAAAIPASPDAPLPTQVAPKAAAVLAIAKARQQAREKARKATPVLEPAPVEAAPTAAILDAPVPTAIAPKVAELVAKSKAADAIPPKRVLEDVRPEAKAEAKANAKAFDEIRTANTPAPEPKEAQPKNRSSAEIEARVSNNTKADEIVAKFPATPDETRVQTLTRVKAMVAAAEEAGVTVPKRLRDNADEAMNHSAGVDLLTEARALATRKVNKKEHFDRFSSREAALRAGGTEAQANVRAERRQEGKIKTEGEVAVADEKISHGDVGAQHHEAENELLAKIDREEAHAEDHSASVTGEEAKAAPLPDARVREGDITAGKDRAGKFVVEKRRSITIPGKIGAKGKVVLSKAKERTEARAAIDHAPTPAQKEAGNYAHGHLRFEGFDISLENAKGGERSGVGPDGKPWSVKMPADYGYFKRTEGKDGDHVDTYIGPKGETGRAYVVNQKDLSTGKLDEHKVILGVESEAEARALYEKGFSDGKGAERIGSIVETTPAHLREWLKDGDQTRVFRSDDGRVSGTKGESFTPIHSSTLKETIPELTLPSSKGNIVNFIAKKMKQVVGDVPIHFVDYDTMQRHSPGAAGYYDPLHDHIVIRAPNGTTSGHDAALTHTILHEAVHAAVYKGLERMPGLKSMIRAIMSEVGSSRGHIFVPEATYGGKIRPLREHYGFANEHEFISEALTNEAFQQYLMQTQMSPELARRLNISEFRSTSLWSGVVAMARRILGLPSHTASALEGVLAVSERASFHRDHAGREAYDNRWLDRQARQSEQRQLYMRDLSVAADVVRDAGEAFRRAISDPVTTAQHALRSAAEASPTGNKFLEKGAKLLSNDQLRQATRRAVGEAFNSAHMRLNDAIEKMGVYARNVREPGDQLSKAYYRASREFEGDRGWDRFVSLAQDATRYNLHPDVGLDDARNRHLALAKDNKGVESDGSMANWQSRARHADLASEFRALPTELQALWRRSQGYFATQQDAMARGLTKNIIGEHGDAAMVERAVEGRLTEADEAVLPASVKDALENAQELRLSKGPYFPAMRHGDYVVTANHAFEAPKNGARIDDSTYEFKTRDEAHKFATELGLEASTRTAYYDPVTGERSTKEGALSQAGDAEARYQVKVNRKHVEFFDTEREARARRDELTRHGLENVSEVDRRSQNKNLDYSISSPAIQKLIDNMRKREDLSEREKGLLEKSLIESSVSLRAGTRVEHRRLPRRNIQGASRDFLRNVVEYNQASSNYRARQEFKPEVDGALKEMKEVTDANRYDSALLDRRTVLQEMENRLYGFGSPEYTGRMAPFWRDLMTVSFIKRMASPAHLMLHMTHPTMISGPVLGARHGFPKAYSAIMQAYRDMGVGAALREGYQGAKRVWKDDAAQPTNFIENFKQRLRDVKDGAALGRMLDELSETGHIHPDAGFEAHRLTAVGNPFERGLSKVDTAFRELTGATESINRVAEAVAAYRLEIARNGGDHAKAIRYTKDTLANTQGLYSATNAAPIFRNPAIRPFLQFKQFPQMIYHLLGRNLYDTFKGETPEVRKEAARAFAAVVGTHAAMAGALGLPLELIKAPMMLASALGVPNAQWEDKEAWFQHKMADVFGPQVGEIISHGLSRALGPFSVDVHHRLGLNSLLFFGEPKSNSHGDIASYLFDLVAGAPGSLFMDTVDAAKAMRDGDYMKAAEKFVPAKAIDDVLKAARLTSEGKLSKLGVGMSPLSPAESFVQALGFVPGRVAQYGEARWEAGKEMREETKQKGELTSAWAKATDGASRVRAMQAVSSWNLSHPESKIDHAALQRAKSRLEDAQEENMLGYGVTDRSRHILERASHAFNVR